MCLFCLFVLCLCSSDIISFLGKECQMVLQGSFQVFSQNFVECVSVSVYSVCRNIRTKGIETIKRNSDELDVLMSCVLCGVSICPPRVVY